MNTRFCWCSFLPVLAVYVSIQYYKSKYPLIIQIRETIQNMAYLVSSLWIQPLTLQWNSVQSGSSVAHHTLGNCQHLASQPLEVHEQSAGLWTKHKHEWNQIAFFYEISELPTGLILSLLPSSHCQRIFSVKLNLGLRKLQRKNKPILEVFLFGKSQDLAPVLQLA